MIMGNPAKLKLSNSINPVRTSQMPSSSIPRLLVSFMLSASLGREWRFVVAHPTTVAVCHGAARGVLTLPNALCEQVKAMASSMGLLSPAWRSSFADDLNLTGLEMIGQYLPSIG